MDYILFHGAIRLYKFNTYCITIITIIVVIVNNFCTIKPTIQ